ncbi:hypothetical protein STEG23_029806, partial [Scotinomys teguina]
MGCVCGVLERWGGYGWKMRILEGPGLGWGIPEERYLKGRGLRKSGDPRGMGISKEREFGGDHGGAGTLKGQARDVDPGNGSQGTGTLKEVDEGWRGTVSIEKPSVILVAAKPFISSSRIQCPLLATMDNVHKWYT